MKSRRGQNLRKNLIDLRGQRFGRLTVRKRVKNTGSTRHVMWRCLCDCGRTTNTLGLNLKRGLIKSCGCLRRETAAVLGSQRIAEITAEPELEQKRKERARQATKSREYRQGQSQLIERLWQDERPWCTNCGQRMRFDNTREPMCRKCKSPDGAAWRKGRTYREAVEHGRSLDWTEKQRQARKRLWQDPNYRAKQMKTRKTSAKYLNRRWPVNKRKLNRGVERPSRVVIGSEEKVRRVLELFYVRHRRQRDIAVLMGCSASHIGTICTGRHYKNWVNVWKAEHSITRPSGMVASVPDIKGAFDKMK